MNKNFVFHISGLLMVLAVSVGCKKEIGSLNGTTVEQLSANATKFQLNNVVTGTESGMRNAIDFYLDAVGMIGREMYRFAGSEPRYTTYLLGGGSATLNNNTFYLTNPWNARYRVVKNCNILIAAANSSTLITPEEKKGYLGFAKTIKALYLLLNLNMTGANGVRIDVSDPDHLGPVVGYDESLTAIAAMLDEAKADFTGSTIAYGLSSGFTGFKNAAGLIKFNRALAARVAVYRKQWAGALTALNESFFDLNGPLNLGVFHVYSSGPNDQLNLTFVGQNQTGEIRLAHPSYAAEITPGDDRIGKATLRTSSASLDNLTSDRDVWVYTSSTAPIPVIRNEELILIYAEAKLQSGSIPDAIVALNRIRVEHNLTPYAGGISVGALTTELLYNRRFSLFMEGHRWVDLRRYNLLGTLPKDRPDDDVWARYPLPQNESNL